MTSASAADREPLAEPDAAAAADALDGLVKVLGQVLFGQDGLIELVVIGLLARGHILLEGLPGLGKTEPVKGVSRALAL